MLSRLALLTLLVPLLCVSLAPTPARAKGSSYIVAATVSGGTLSTPNTVPVRLPQNLDDMFELDAPQGVDGASLPYELTLHYDFSEDGYGNRDWAGRFDGKSTLYFPESMVVGPGVWAAGWYTAVDVLADALAGGAAASTDQQAFPSTGNGSSIRSGGAFDGASLALLGLTLLIAGFAIRRRALLALAMACALIALSCDGDGEQSSTPIPRAPTFEGVYRGSDEGKVYPPIGDIVQYSVCADGHGWARPTPDDQRRHLVSLGGEFSTLASQGYLLQQGWLWTFVEEGRGEQYALARSGLWAASPETSGCDRSGGLTMLIEHEVMEMRFEGETVWIKARYVPGYFQYVEYSLPADIHSVSYQLIAEDGTWVDGCCT